jgi:glutathione S-transferase
MDQLAQPIRLLLAYLDIEFEDKYYVCGPAPDFDKSCWFDVKHTLGFDFPNVCISVITFMKSKILK